MSKKFPASWKNGWFLSVSHKFFTKSDKSFLEQFSACMMCCFKKYANTLVYVKLSQKLKMVTLSKSKDFEIYMINGI